ncbi:hypothetical protein ACLOJK_018423 [Asimina triloba]
MRTTCRSPIEILEGDQELLTCWKVVPGMQMKKKRRGSREHFPSGLTNQVGELGRNRGEEEIFVNVNFDECPDKEVMLMSILQKENIDVAAMIDRGNSAKTIRSSSKMMAGVIEDDGREIQWAGFLREIQWQTMAGFRQGFKVDKVSADDDRVLKSTRFRKWKRKPTKGTNQGEKKMPTRGARETEKKETLTRATRETEG